MPVVRDLFRADFWLISRCRNHPFWKNGKGSILKESPSLKISVIFQMVTGISGILAGGAAPKDIYTYVYCIHVDGCRCKKMYVYIYIPKGLIGTPWKVLGICIYIYKHIYMKCLLEQVPGLDQAKKLKAFTKVLKKVDCNDGLRSDPAEKLDADGWLDGWLILIPLIPWGGIPRPTK